MMSAHIHAALMAEYAKDALETDTPWERWEWRLSKGRPWNQCRESPNWHAMHAYRRKRIVLCQVEGRDVFLGDKLWHVEKGWLTAIAMDGSNLVCIMEDGDTWRPSFSYLSWTEPPKTKTVYQWAFLRGTWQVSFQFYETEEQAQRGCLGGTNFRRLDYTALEVPA